MSVKIDVSTRGRTCRYCREQIPAGEYHLRFSGGRQYPDVDNICAKCLADYEEQIRLKNLEAVK